MSVVLIYIQSYDQLELGSDRKMLVFPGSIDTFWYLHVKLNNNLLKPLYDEVLSLVCLYQFKLNALTKLCSYSKDFGLKKRGHFRCYTYYYAKKLMIGQKLAKSIVQENTSIFIFLITTLLLTDT